MVMVRNRREVVLSAHITFHRLERQGQYTTKVPIQDIDAPRERLEEDLRRAIGSELPHEMHEIFDLTVRTRVIAIRPGSIALFFGVLVSGYGFLATYHDFYESISLIRKQSQALLERVMERHLQGNYSSDVSVSVEFPALPSPDELHPWRRILRRFGPEADMFGGLVSQFAPTSSRRDGFFWWLLITNILMAAGLATLVARAVAKVYFH